MRQTDKFAVVFYNSSCRYSSVVGVACPEKKEKVPHPFSLEQALGYLSQRRVSSISRGYDIARIHHLENEKVGEVYRTYQLDWKEVPNEEVKVRKLD